MRQVSSHAWQARDETASDLAEGEEATDRAQSRRYQVTRWSNSKAGSGADASGSTTGVWSNVFQTGGPRAGESTGGLVGSPICWRMRVTEAASVTKAICDKKSLA